MDYFALSIIIIICLAILFEMSWKYFFQINPVIVPDPLPPYIEMLPQYSPPRIFIRREDIGFIHSMCSHCPSNLIMEYCSKCISTCCGRCYSQCTICDQVLCTPCFENTANWCSCVFE